MTDSKLADAFDHVVVLMLENRSFDCLLGYLYEDDRPARFIPDNDPEFRGVAGKEHELWNYDDSDPPKKIHVGKAPFETQQDMCQPFPDPGEEYKPHVNCQVYSDDEASTDIKELPHPAPMSGFVKDFIRTMKTEEWWDKHITPTEEHYRVIMNCFTPDAVPVLNTLAREFAVSDEWFCSVPSQTFCNRSFFNSASSHGFVTNSDYIKWRHNKQTTIFQRLSEHGHDWRVYWDETDLWPLTRLIHEPLRHHSWHSNFRKFKHFEDDCKEGNLPAYTFIEPRLFFNHNDMHPAIFLNPLVDSSILAGDLLAARVYDAVRNGANWERTLLVITFDEHGGTYDHWPPNVSATPPDKSPSYELESHFQFDRFGIRVPTIFISPFIDAGTVVRSRESTPFDHTSMIKTICRRWGMPGLTDRDAAAPDFSHVFTRPRSEPRLDTPEVRPRPYKPAPEPELHDLPLNGLQKAIVGLASHLQEVEKLPEALGEVFHKLERHQ